MLSSRTASPTNAPTHLELSSRALLNARRAFSSLLSFTKQWPIPKRTSAKKIKSSHLICQTTILLGFERKKCLNILFMNWKTPELISVQLCCKIFWCITNLVSLEVRPLSPTPCPASRIPLSPQNRTRLTILVFFLSSNIPGYTVPSISNFQRATFKQRMKSFIKALHIVTDYRHILSVPSVMLIYRSCQNTTLFLSKANLSTGH